jgi:acetolactate synthase-1/2/3 large subunit
VTHVFGLVGSHVLELYDALLDAPHIRHITVKHETTASGMADAWGRLTGKPGVCFVTAGPGSTNSLTGVAQAYMSASPLIHVSGAVPQGASFESFHGVDKADFLVGVFKDVAKWSVAVERPEDIPHVFAEAFRIAQSDRPGPVHIELPENVLLADATEMDTYAPLPIEQTPLDANVVSAIAERVRASQRPLIWAGKGVKASFADAELAELAELLEAPVILAGDAAGGLPDIHPLATGQLSLYALTPLQQKLARDADLVIAVGERGGTGFADALFGSVSAPVVGAWLGNAGEAPDARATGIASGVAHARAALNQLVEVLGDQQRPRDETLRARIAREGNGLRQVVLDDARDRFNANRPMHYGLALEGLAQFVDDDTIVLGDIGSHNQWTRLVVETRNRDTFHPEGYWGAMGFALPAAMAAKLARPDKKVVGVTGDGCFLMASADFATAVEHGINPVIVILNDHQYGMIVGMQQGYYGRSSATALDGPDFVAFARSFGGDGMRVEAPEQLAEALERGLASERIFVIDAICDHRLPDYDFAAAATTVAG